jgi:RNA polymerase sigma factor (sigma-70 family)
VAAEATTASEPSRPRFGGRPDHGAAAARTEQLFADHGRLVSGLCRALLRDRAEAEDAAQQTFLSAHRALLNGSSPAEPAAWLATIARNECWARIKTRMRQPLPTEHIEDERSTADPVGEAIRNADLAALWSAIAALPQQQRDALLLREFGGLSYTELAAALAVTGPAVESLLFRARHGVRARLEAAYAALTGASWVESLARLFGGIGGGIAPVAAKVAVVSVGAAVATGGYVAAPHVLHSSKPSPLASTRASSPAPIAVLVGRTRSTVAAAPAAPAPVSVSRRIGGDSGEHGAARRQGADDREATTASGSDGSDTHESDHGTTTRRASTSERSQGGESDTPSGSDAGSSGGGPASDGSGEGSGDGEGHGGVVTTATNPAVTVTLPVTGTTPPAGAPVPTTGG